MTPHHIASHDIIYNITLYRITLGGLDVIRVHRGNEVSPPHQSLPFKVSSEQSYSSYPQTCMSHSGEVRVEIQ